MPRDVLTRDQIVDAAIGLLDEHGLEGLTMRSLGQRLDSAATAVYWHVGSKDNLITLAADRLWAEVPLPDPAEHGWRPAAAAMAHGLLAMLGRHPWLVQTLGAHLVYGPGKARHDDHNLAVWEYGGFAGPAADRAAGAVFTYVLGNALGAAALATLTRRFDREPGGAAAALRAATSQAVAIAAEFPRLRARLDSAATDSAATDYAAAPDDTFATGLDALLDGLAARHRG